MSSVTTMGSVIAIDGGGSHWLKYGSARRHVEKLQVVLSDGQVLEVGREMLGSPSNGDVPRKSQLVADLEALLTREQAVIRDHQPRTLVNRCGYQLADVLQDNYLDVGRIVAGSEGTLAIITEATLSTQPLPRHRSVALLLFDRLESAAKAVTEVLPLGPSACDLMDRRHLSLAREATVHFDLLIPPEAEAALLVEYEGDVLTEVRDRLAQIVDRVRRKKRLSFHAFQAHDRDEMDLYWGLARNVVPTLYRLKGSTRPLPFVEDVAVPPRELSGFLVRMQNILKQHQVTASLFAHAGHGQLHLRPFLDLSNPDDVARMQPLATDLYAAATECGGTISGEHGTGLSRTAYLRQQCGPLVDVFREVKQIFDPIGILNPGKVVGDDPNLLTRHLRRLRPTANGDPAEATEPGSPSLPVVSLQLTWTPEQMADSARDCNGCGACRSQLSDVRMCPIFRFAPAEESSPRAKANLVRAVLSGRLPPTALTSEEFKNVADLCVNCHMCRLECPASVDIPRLMTEAKGAYVQVNGLRARDWLLSRIDTLSAAGSFFSPIANWAITNRAARWLLEKTVGIAQRRKLPRFANRSFVRLATRRRLTRPTRRSGRKILYFVDTYANYHDPQLAEALVAVLEHHGIAVYVHPKLRASGMAMISLGALGQARQLAARNVAFLADAVRLGYHIVTTEPSAALCLTREYLALFDDDDARLVAQNTSEACSYLWKLHQGGQLRLDFRPLIATLGYHQPCHLKALQVGSPGESLLRLVPGLIVTRMESGCSGMAGTFGLRRENFRASLRAGRPLIRRLRSGMLQAGATECSTCKMQMEQGADKPTIHPLKILAHSYGLLPEVGDFLATRSEALVVT